MTVSFSNGGPGSPISPAGKVAEVAERYLKKGSKVLIEGQLQTRKWEKDGKTNYTTEVVVRGFNGNMTMLDSRDGSGGGGYGGGGGGRY